MKKKILNFKELVMPKSITKYLIIGLIILGLIAGSIFFLSINKIDQEEAKNEVISFYQNINNNGQSLKNGLITNTIYLLSIFVLSLTIIGLPLIIFLIFFKGFILGFCISTIISCYHYKGILYSFLYLFPHELIKLLCLILTGFYGITLSIKLIKLIFSSKHIDYKLYLKRYSVVMLFSFILTILALIYETYIYQNVIKLFI